MTVSREQLIQWCWQGAVVGGIACLEPAYLAQRHRVPIVEITAYIPSRFYGLLLLVEDVLSRIDLPERHGERAEDYLFDGIMAYFDGAQPHREAIAKIWSDLCWYPRETIQLIPQFTQPINYMVDQAFGDNTWLVQQVHYKAYQILLVETFLVWLDDYTSDLAKTMAKLDFGLKRLQACRDYFSSWA